MSKLDIVTFTNLGYELHARAFEPITEDLGGKTVVVTGASGGLGLEASRQLAKLGARVIMVGRSPDKLTVARDSVPGASTELADLSLMAEVRELARRIIETGDPVDVLINNVGVLLPTRQVTDEGIERTLATNLAGQFLLTNLLIPQMAESAPARVISVSSGGMYSTRIDPDDIEFERREYTGTAAYANTKRGQVIVTEMWAERFPGHEIVFHSMHPGWAKTAGVAYSLPTFNKLMRPFLRTPAQGADTIVWLAAAREAATTTGQFWFDRQVTTTHMTRSTRESADDRARLWERLATLTRSDAPVRFASTPDD